jgi:AraC family transcriptional regulator
MAEHIGNRLSDPSETDGPSKLFLVPKTSPVSLQFRTVDSGALHKLVPGPAWVEQDGRRVRISLLHSEEQNSAIENEPESCRAGETCIPSGTDAADGLSPSQFRRVLSFISEHLSSNLNLSDLAREANLSTAYFSQRFKSSTGTSPHQYLLKLRICRAKILLAETEAPVIDIAAECGFQTQQHFARIFRRLTTKTPTEYRRERQRFLLASTYASLTAHGQ